MTGSPALPLYVQLKNHIHEQIARGEWLPDSPIPSQRTLSQQHQMSYMTVRRALNDMVNEGWLYTIPGKGFYVARFGKQEAESGLFVGFSDDMASRGLSAHSQVLEAELINASMWLAQIFEGSTGMQLVMVRRLRFANGDPVVVQTAWLPHQRVPNILSHDFGRESLYHVLQSDYGITFGSAESSVEAALADSEQCRLLKLEMPTALLITEQVTRASDGAVVEFVRSFYCGDRYKMRLRADTKQIVYG